MTCRSLGRGLASLMIVIVAVARTWATPEVPGKPQQQPIALVGGLVHTVSGADIEGGTVVFNQGKLTAIGKDVAIPDNAERIDIRGKHVYPGLIDALSTIGLVEIEAVRATVDVAETGLINPNVKAQVAFNPDSEAIPVARANGVLLAIAMPQGGVIAGQSALMMLDGWTYEDMALKAPAAMHVTWPRMTPVVRSFGVDPEEQQSFETRNQRLESLRKAFGDARAYWLAKRSSHPLPNDLRWEALGLVLDRQLPIVVHADEAQQIQAAVAFAEKENVRIILAGGYDALRCVELLKKHDIPVIVSRTHRIPQRAADGYDEPFTLPERLRQAGLKYCIAHTGRFEASSVGNLPYQAGTAAAHGLPPAEALKSITLYAAEILGVAHRVGSLAVGKDATLFIADGDILETPTLVERAYIQGRLVDLNNRHKRLWTKYQEKYRRQGAAR